MSQRTPSDKSITNLRAGATSQQTIYSDLIPSTDNVFSVGLSNLRWQHLYAYAGSFAAGTLFIS